MGENVDVKPESLFNLDDLLQCPVCYEIPYGQIFQCNEGHHVCGRCKVRLDVCPVCRALFFGTRNYAMEELIANFRKITSIKSGKGAGPSSSDSNSSAKDVATVEPENNTDDQNTDNNSLAEPLRPPPPCKGLFRCLCCKIGKTERLPISRLLNHLRYYHAPDLIEGRAENGEYVQAWQISTVPGRLVTAVRVAEMGVFFLVIEITSQSIHAWLTMACSPWIAQSYNYTITLSGVDREAIFSDVVGSVRSCEGSLKKRGHTLKVTGADATALFSAAALAGKLSVRRTTAEQAQENSLQPPRAIMRVANRGSDTSAPLADLGDNLNPLLQELTNDVAQLSRAFAFLGREAGALSRYNSQVRARIEGREENHSTGHEQAQETVVVELSTIRAPVQNGQIASTDRPLSQNARRRMRQRLRAMLNEANEPDHGQNFGQHASSAQRQAETTQSQPQEPVLQQQPTNGPELQGQPSTASTGQSGRGRGRNPRANGRKRRQRR